MCILYKIMELMVYIKSLSAKVENAKMTKQAYMNATKYGADRRPTISQVSQLNGLFFFRSRPPVGR